MKIAGVDFNVSDQYGWTALMCASYAGHLHIVKYLLSMGVDISKRLVYHCFLIFIRLLDHSKFQKCSACPNWFIGIRRVVESTKMIRVHIGFAASYFLESYTEVIPVWLQFDKSSLQLS